MLLTPSLKTKISLALMPTILVILVLVLLESFSRQRVLFASLASSAFLIYLDPKHPTNSIRTLVIAQVSAAIIGYIIYLTVGTGYLSAALAMIIIVTLMIATNAMHPPAVSTSLLFAFQDSKPNTLMLFMFSVLLLVILIVLQRASLWLLKREAQTDVHLSKDKNETI